MLRISAAHARTLRLVNGNELVNLVFEHYESFGPEWKRLLPLRRVYVADREREAT